MMLPNIHNMQNIVASLWQMIDPKNWTKFIRDPREKQHNIPQDVENMLLAHGHKPEVSPENNDREHIASLEKLMRTPDYQIWPQAFKLNAEEHLQHHKAKRADTAALQRGTQNPMQDESDMMRGQHEAGA